MTLTAMLMVILGDLEALSVALVIYLTLGVGAASYAWRRHRAT